MQSVYLAGTDMTKFGKGQRALAAIMQEAAEEALAAAEINDIDAIFVGLMNAEEFSDSNLASQVAEGLGRTGVARDHDQILHAFIKKNPELAPP